MFKSKNTNENFTNTRILKYHSIWLRFLDAALYGRSSSFCKLYLYKKQSIFQNYAELGHLNEIWGGAFEFRPNYSKSDLRVLWTFPHSFLPRFQIPHLSFENWEPNYCWRWHGLCPGPPLLAAPSLLVSHAPNPEQAQIQIFKKSLYFGTHGPLLPVWPLLRRLLLVRRQLWEAWLLLPGHVSNKCLQHSNSLGKPPSGCWGLAPWGSAGSSLPAKVEFDETYSCLSCLALLFSRFVVMSFSAIVGSRFRRSGSLLPSSWDAASVVGVVFKFWSCVAPPGASWGSSAEAPRALGTVFGALGLWPSALAKPRRPGNVNQTEIFLGRRLLL